MEPMDELENRFGFHGPPSKETAELHEEVRRRHLELAQWVYANIPGSRESSLAQTSLQQSAMWCNAAVAINRTPLSRPR